MKLNKTTIIAEAGVNHNGKIKNAFKLIDIAKDAGADYVKFQYFNADLTATDQVKKATYQLKNFKQKNQSQKIMLKKLMLNLDQLITIKNYCKKKKIKFLVSIFDHLNVKNLNKLNLDVIKIASGEITNYPLLKEVAKLKKRVILSTGMCNEQDIRNALNIFRKFKLNKKKITLLHCTTNYPVQENEANLLAIQKLKDKFNLNIGYSDHTVGSEAAIIAITLGAKIIEKHFTIDKKMKGPDHKASLNPLELKEYILKIKKTSKLLGKKIKKISHNEKKIIRLIRKSIYAKRNIVIGEKFTEENIIPKRPFTGISPLRWNDYIGKKAKKNYAKNEKI